MTTDLQASNLQPGQGSRQPRVLEIGNYAAAYSGRLWAQTGADVVQVTNGALSPSWVSTAALQAFTDTGKRRATLATSEDVATLAARADVVICEAATADELLALGFDHWSTKIKVAITPFGLTGPRRNWRATPNVLLAMGGYTNMMGDPERAPLTLPGHYTEFQTGALAFAAAQAAQFAQTSERIDLGMLEVLASLHQYTTVRYQANGDVRRRRGSDLWFVVPSDLFACNDGWVYITVTPNFWEMFVLLIDAPELLLDERFADNDLRMQNRQELRQIIAAFCADRSCAELEARAEEFRVPLGIAQTPAEVLADKHLEARDIWQLLEVPGHNQVRAPGLPWRGQQQVNLTQGEPQQCDWQSLW